jgi:hydrogenase nickel incorporation protein HypA/HybF
MHELTLAQGILDSVNESALRERKQVASYRIGVGELAQFDMRLLRKLFRELSKGTPLEGAKISFELERSRLQCLGCGREMSFDDISDQLSKQEREMVHFLPELLNSCAKCPTCSRSYFEIEAGRSVRVMEIVFDE